MANPSIAAETSGCLNVVQSVFSATQAQLISDQSASLPTGVLTTPWKVGINGTSTYSGQDIMGTFAGGTFYPYPTNAGVPMPNNPEAFTGSRAEYWPDPGELNQKLVIYTQCNSLYRI